MQAHGTPATQAAPVPRLRPLSLGETLDVAIKLCIAHRTTLLKAIVVVIVPVQVLPTIVMLSTGSGNHDVFASMKANQTDSETNTYLAGQLGASVLQGLAVALATAVCFRAFARGYLGQATDWRESLRFAFRRISQMLWLGLMYLLALIVGVALVVVPAVLADSVAGFVVVGVVLFVALAWIFVSGSFALPVLFVEDRRGVKALRRSFGLVRRRWWPTFGTILVGYVLATVVSSVAQGVFAVVLIVGVDSK